jgi:hypothetical protein
MLRLLSQFLRALFQFSKRAAGKATKFGRSGVKLLGVVGAARLECGGPAAESGELIRRQLGNSFGDFLDFHGAQLTSSNLLFKFVACTTGISISFLSFRIFPTVRQKRTAFKSLLRRSIQPRPWPIILRAFWMSSRGGPHFSDHF